jgi:hypothetical protein
MGLRHLAPSSRERLCVGNCIPYRILVSTKALSGIIRPSSGMIRIRWVGHHYNRNFLIRIVKISPSWIKSRLGVMKISPNWIGSRLGVSQSVILTSSRWEPRGLKCIHHSKIIGWNRHRGGRDIGQNLFTSWVVPSIRRRIRPKVKNRDTSYIRIHLGNMRTTKWERSVRRCSAPKSKASVRANSWDGSRKL